MKCNSGKWSFLLASGLAILPVAALADEVADQPATNKAGGIESEETIVVTARRFEEKLQDVPIAITAYTQQQLDERNVANPNDLAAFTPSLTANPRFGVENTTFSIRGFIQDVFTAPSVAVYFAEAVALRGASSVQSGEGAGPGSFFDLQNVQVLKGPQGTLFGRNTTGGAVLLVPRKPTSEFGGYVEGSYGNYDMTRLQGVVNIPVGEGGLRLGFDRMTRDGYIKNIGIGPDRMGNVNYIAGRISFLQPLTPDLENYTIATFAKSDTVGSTPQPTRCNSTAMLGNVPSGLMACDSLARIRATGDFYTVENPIEDPRSYLKQWQFINTTTWNVSDDVTLKNIVTYGELRNIVSQDPLGTYWKIRADDPVAGAQGTNGNYTGSVIFLAQANAAPGLYSNAQSTFTEELQLHAISLDGKLDWQAGGYFESSKTLDPYVGTKGRNLLLCSDIANLVCQSPYGATGSVTEGLRNTTYRDFGIYAQGIYSITDSLRLTAGIRYSENASKGIDEQRTYRFVGGRIITSCSNANGVLPDCIIVTPASGYFKTSAPTWLISLDYKPSVDTLLYAKYARGYRQGTVDSRSLAPYKTFGPEKLDSYEVGGKASWHGAVPGFLNLAAFYNDFGKQQFLNTWSDINGARTTTGIANTAQSRLYGLEADAGVEPFAGFRLTGGMTYLNTKLLEVNSPSVPPPGYPIVIESESVGRPFPLAPKFKSYVRAGYTLPIDDALGRLTLSGTWQHTSGYFSSGREFSHIDGYSTLNLAADWKDVGGAPLDLGFFVNNLTEKHYYTFATDTLSRGVVTALLGEPRTLGVRARVRFGSDAD
ncbi:iron complex outermembrane recepter protein [Novosphingobium sp. CF614]|uniref:TonB-dependent receptor n=1 Tax=Novosphingobium sp. CF614 TaxID=1884364 RepID=UPI0008F18811|nr:TonB-dependent receptor [Novosphingobium sp. CF614]SFF96166.1 iron complex outermembrane recepter protein [Novosphingobium sp. CF614]